MAIPLDVVRAQNDGLKDSDTRHVGVFVGGTSGIGEFTLKAFARRIRRPTIYIIGRNDTAALTISNAVTEINPQSQVVFIKTDVSLLRNVDTACREIQAKEDKVNLLFLTSSFLSFDGRNETSEGIDKRLCLNYYSRMRFVHNLLPQLTAAANDAGSLSRVVSVLSAGHEGPVVEDDLELKRNFSFVNCRNHGCVMNDFACEELAKHHPGTAFLHVYPGLVRTGILDHGGLLLKVLGRLMMTLLFAMEVSAHESGERNLFHASAPLFAPRATAGPDAAMGSDGTRGSGAYLLNWDGKPIGNAKVLDAMRQKQLGQRIWEHTLEVFGRLEQQNHAQQS